MIPFIPVDNQVGRIGDWGFPHHGLFTLIHQDAFAQDQGVITEDRSFLRTATGFIIGYPDYSGLGPGQDEMPPTFAHRKFPNTANSRRIVVPGHTYTRAASLAAFDTAKGIDYKPYAIINDRFIGGFANPYNTLGWIYVADDGSRWNVNVVAQISRPNWASWTFVFQRMGLLQYPNATWGIVNRPDDTLAATHTYHGEGSAGIDDFDSITDTTHSIQPGLLDINSNGSAALFGGFDPSLGTFSPQLYENFNPNAPGTVNNQRKAVAGIDPNSMAAPHIIWRVSLSGVPDNTVNPLTAVITVERDQAACGGTIEAEDDDLDAQYTLWGGAYFVTCGTTGPQFGRPQLATGACGGSAYEIGPVTMGSVSLLGAPALEADARACGWERYLVDGTSVLGTTTNEFNSFQWWQFDNDAAPPLGEDWAASKEYSVNDRLVYAGIPFICTLAHTSDETLQPGVGAVWTDAWGVEFEATNHDIADVQPYAFNTGYDRFDSVRHGAADYYIAKGSFTSYDLDPEKIDHDEPGVGVSWENFWDGPFNILLNPVWLENRLIKDGWVLPVQYTENALVTNKTLANATWRCIRTHVSSADNKPGTGSQWPLYWEKAFLSPSSAIWEPPEIFVTGDRVTLDIGGSDFRTYVAVIDHTATAANQPPNGTFWTEDATAPDCFDPQLTALPAALNETSYHVNEHTPRDHDVDYHIKNITAGMMFKEDDTTKLIEVDIRYQRTLRDKVFEHAWDTGCDPDQPFPSSPCSLGDDDVQEFEGSTSRGPSQCVEQFQYDFRVAGVLKKTFVINSTALSTGQDDWTENYTTYPLTWNAEGSASLQVQWQGQVHADYTYAATQDDTLWGGATGDDVLAQDKGSWSVNDFVSGKTFEFIDAPYLDNFYQQMKIQIGRSYPGAGLSQFEQPTVLLDPISSVDQYNTTRPDRTAEQVARGEPVPSIYTMWYSRKLVGPLSLGRKNNSGIALDSQYLRILEPDDMRWIQLGVFAADAEQGADITLTAESPKKPRSTWLFDKDYGDDIACAYDPITKTITRNSQYRVVYI